MKEIMQGDTNLWPGWETVRLIGRGSFGAVYEIQRDMLGDLEKAALKVISIPQNANDVDELYADGFDEESITSAFQSHLKSIVAEYSLMRKMNGCTNIVNCDDIRYIQHEDGIGWDIFIKMELLTPLTKALPEQIPETLVVRLAKDMCTALELCKKHDIVHRDIKPQNIFVSPNGDYKLGDFGIAKTMEKTTGGTKIGTYKYMAPEVYNNQPYGSAADIYSLGLVLYWLLNEKRMPFMPLPPEKVSIGMDEKARQRRLSGEALPAPAHGSVALQRIVLKACAYDPKDRYASSADMARDLNRAFGGADFLSERERAEQERLELERIARQKAEQERIAREKAEQERIAREKAEQERIAREKAEQERIAREKAEQERIAREKAEQERIAREKAAQERIAREKAAQERVAREKAEQHNYTISAKSDGIAWYQAAVEVPEEPKPVFSLKTILREPLWCSSAIVTVLWLLILWDQSLTFASCFVAALLIVIPSWLIPIAVKIAQKKKVSGKKAKLLEYACRGGLILRIAQIVCMVVLLLVCLIDAKTARTFFKFVSQPVPLLELDLWMRSIYLRSDWLCALLVAATPVVNAYKCYAAHTALTGKKLRFGKGKPEAVTDAQPAQKPAKEKKLWQKATVEDPEDVAAKKMKKTVIGVFAGLLALVLVLVIVTSCLDRGPEIQSIRAVRYPEKLSYTQGQHVDLSGLGAVVTYEDGKSEYIDSGFDCSPSKLTSTGHIKITVSYKDIVFYVFYVDVLSRY